MINRRDAMMGLGQVGLGAMTLPGLLRAEKAQAAAKTGPGRAKSCILLFLWGGPPQQDMWDLKPDAPEGIRGPFKPIKSSLPGLDVGELLPNMAKVMDRVTLIRTVTHGSDVHEPSVYHMLTGQVDPSMVIPRNNRLRRHWPGPAGIVSCLRPSVGNIPSSVTLPRPIHHDGVKYAGTHAGWLGAQYDPVELPDAGFSKVTPPASAPKGFQVVHPTWEMGLPPGVDAGRLVKRRGLLSLVETQRRYLDQNPDVLGMDAFRERAFDLLTSTEAKQALDLERETPALRDRYGRNHYGESFLLARRLVQAGVRLVTVNWMFFRPDGNPLNPWDNHGGTPALGGISGMEMLKREYCIPPLDQAYAALIEDLDARGLLDETLVVAMGEFGRTPKINAAQGRDHWGACQSVLLAGGGIRRGFVHGTSDAHAAYPAEDPVRPEDLHATLYQSLGLPPDSMIYDPERRPHFITTGKPINAVFG
jgi:hypothetical protein